MLDPSRTFAAGSRSREPRDEPRAEPHLAHLDGSAKEARLLRALRDRVRRVEVERASDSLRERVRAMLDVRA